MLWLLIGSPGGPRRAHAASKQLPSEGVRERAARLQATCLSPSQEPSRHIPEQAPKEAHSLVSFTNFTAAAWEGGGLRRQHLPHARERVSPTRVAGLQWAPGIASSLSKAWRLPRGGQPLAQTSAGPEGAGRLETWGENQAFGVRWTGFTPPASSTV